MAEVEIGIGKSGRRAYGFDDIAIVPSRRTRDPEDVDISWEIDAFRFDAAAHGVGDGRRRQPGDRDRDRPPRRRRRPQPRGSVDPLRGSRAAASRRSPSCPTDKATQRMQEIYGEPIKPELIGAAHPRDQGGRRRVVRVGHAAAHRGVRQGHPRAPSSTCSSSRARSCRPSTSRKTVEPLNLKTFVRELDIPVIVGGCASYQAALHLMRTGAAGILVGVGPGHACTTRGVLGIGVPQATAIADARAARMRHLDETGVYVHVIADGGMAHRRRHRQGDRVRRRRGDARLAAGGRGRGARPGLPLGHGDVPSHAAPRRRVKAATRGTLAGDPRRPRPRERRAHEPLRRAAHARWRRAATSRSRSSRRPK